MKTTVLLGMREMVIGEVAELGVMDGVVVN
jgi:hypothetical protein